MIAQPPAHLLKKRIGVLGLNVRMHLETRSGKPQVVVQFVWDQERVVRLSEFPEVVVQRTDEIGRGNRRPSEEPERFRAEMALHGAEFAPIA